ncbi:MULTISPECIES: S-layer homology domain-containing protein [Nostoc]|uniref:S-layer homology domain-containing protein n=1 Tax=Nostoc paludosum FACHB-159 TaxID=2692908 RepID=A0ABR8KDE6_9NOSO|nr:MULTISPECIES: S-layer homology domain-containing protein [Nostoc]MBD2680361.1 S-layer homology domain-containing protein [Nostoc sp. FACHB-857]MBD2736749.1 S-layer homology domain-containing protein [Nostoc paludosum FACHB-159]MDZ8105025.1 S-layer homology domain-containing protein [Nostoc sp. DedQUE12a]
MSSIGLLPFATLTTTLALATIIFYPSKTLSQTPSDGRNTVPQTGCLSGYPDDTYGGSRPVTRYEFAAGLNRCLNQLNQVIPARADLATKQDLEILLKRQRELNQQIRELNQRVDTLPATK